MKQYYRWGAGGVQEHEDDNDVTTTAPTHHVALDQDTMETNITTKLNPLFKNSKLHKKERLQLLISALAFCVTGVIHHIKHLPSLSTSKSSMESGQPPWMQQDLFVPSMDFHILSPTTSSTDDYYYYKNYNNRQGQYPVDQIWDCTKRAKDMQWEWYNTPSSPRTGTATTTTNSNAKHKKTRKQKTTSQTKPRLLIGLSSGYDKYAEMLALSAHLAKVYAHTHDATVVVLQGTALAPDGCTGPAWFTTFNKIRLLFAAIDRRDLYDQLLLLEADALIVNMTVDIRTLLSSSSTSMSSQEVLIAAQPIRQGDFLLLPEKYQIQAGVTLWNLHHPQCTIVALQWFEEARKAVTVGTYWGDEPYLHAVLQRQNQDIIRWLDKKEFAYEEGTIVKHFFSTSRHSSAWSHRKRRMERVAKSVCQNYNCTVLPRKDYDAIAQL